MFEVTEDEDISGRTDERPGFPAALVAYGRVMSRAYGEEARRRARVFILREAGFSQEQVERLADLYENASGTPPEGVG